MLDQYHPYSLPEDVGGLVRSFSEGSLNTGFVPRALKPRLEACKLEIFPDYVFTDEENLSALERDRLVDHVETVAQKSALNFALAMSWSHTQTALGDDELSPYSIVDAILDFRNLSLQTSISKNADRPSTQALLVERPGAKRIRPHPLQIPGRDTRADFCYCFNPSQPEWSLFYDNWNRSNKAQSYNLSPFDSERAVDIIPCCFVQVEPFSGGYLEAQVQGTELSMATLRNLMQVRSTLGVPDPEGQLVGSSPMDLKPLPFITVVGQIWSLHWAYKREDNTIDIIGPVNIGGTYSYGSIYKLVNAIAKLKDWLETEYGVWVKKWYSECFAQES
ncbi:hypothetical protein TWF481_011414 [Arthrobotrys musiformis]|uniref:PD-(D/E)XK nuclease-like domain-containing protein n=1 Tax=Arthrobotrys musiformis TaxID=47236 RepID=A0AAV9VZQ0_9PEZI